MTINEIREVLKDGGILYEFDNPLSYGLDDKDQNTLADPHKHQVDYFIRAGFVKVKRVPALGVTEYIWNKSK